MKQRKTLPRSAAMVLAYLAGSRTLDPREVPAPSVEALEERGAVMVDDLIRITDSGRAAVLRWDETLGAKLHAGGRQLSDLHRLRLITIGEEGRIYLDASRMPAQIPKSSATTLETWRRILASVYGGLTHERRADG
jgi:hypothetical protein